MNVGVLCRVIPLRVMRDLCLICGVLCLILAVVCVLVDVGVLRLWSVRLGSVCL